MEEEKFQIICIKAYKSDPFSLNKIYDCRLFVWSQQKRISGMIDNLVKTTEYEVFVDDIKTLTFNENSFFEHFQLLEVHRDGQINKILK
jgi:hypothetical protein